MTTKRNDDHYRWSGHGIAQEDGQDWLIRQLDQDAAKGFGFQVDKGYTSPNKVECDYTEEGDVLKAAKSATDNFNPDYGKGKPGTKSCDGF